MLEIEIRTTAPKIATEIALGAEALEAAKLGLAFGVDLPAVERFALVLLAEDFVGRVDFGEALGCLGVVLVGVRVQLLGELAIRALDCRRIRTLFYPQYLIGVAHR